MIVKSLIIAIPIQLNEIPDSVIDDRLVEVHLRLGHAAELGEAVPLEEQEGRDRRGGAEEPRDQRVADEVGRRLGEVGVLKLLGIVESSLFQIIHYKDQDS